MKNNLCFVMLVAIFATFSTTSLIAFGRGISGWQSSAEMLSPGFIATDITEPQLTDIGVYDIATGDGITYEFIYEVPEVMGASSAFMGSLSAPTGQSAGLKFDQWPNSGTYGATAFGVADYTSAVPHAVGEVAHVVFVADGTDLGIYVNGEFAESLAGASIALSGMTGIGHAYNHGNEGSVDALDGVILGVAVYDSALSADAISGNFTAFVPEPGAFSIALVLGLCGMFQYRRRVR